MPPSELKSTKVPTKNAKGEEFEVAVEEVEEHKAGENQEQKEEQEEEEAEGGDEAEEILAEEEEEEDEEVEAGEGEEEDEEGREGAERPNLQQTEDVAMQNGDDEAAAAAAAYRPPDAPASEEDNGPHGERGKVFIGGLTWETTTEMLTSHFKKYGEMTDSVIMKNRATGHPRGFGFVTFSDPSVLDIVLKDNHVIDGRTVEVKRTVPRDKMSGASKGALKTKKIFVGGLTTSTTEAELKAYFSKFGKVLEHQIMQDHGSGRSRGFGFVTFESEQAVEDILTQGSMHELDGKHVEIKKAEPKRANQEFPGSRSGGRSGYPAGRGGGGRSGYPAGRGGGYGANTGLYGAFNGGDAYYGGGVYGRGGGRPGGYPYAGAYGYGGGFGVPYDYADAEDGYSGMGYNYAGYASGTVYGFNYGSGYGSGSRGYGNGRYHPYNR